MLVDELRTAVRYRKVSDVPVGVFLSGGIDSSTNAALFAEGETNPIKTFTIGYRGDNQSYQNETHFARLMAGEVGADYHELLLEMDDMLSFLPRMVHLQDEPIADPVCVPLYYVSKLARDNGVIVCQVGEGADELFCGYPGWRRALQIENAGRLPGARWLFRNLASPLLRAGGVAERQSAQWLERVGRGKPAFWGGAELLSDAEKLRFLSPRLRKRFAECSAWDVLGPIHDRFKSAAWEASPLHWMSYLDLSIRLPELLLMRVDKMTMGTSLEARVPFLDHHFVTLAMSIPSELKTRNGVLKSLLKRSVRGLIPDVLIDRPKQGFGVPMHEWIMGRLGTEVRNAFHESTGDIFDIPAVTGLVDSGEARKSWSIYNFVAWPRAFLTPPATVG
jgi:asparagine synthase (glutamine-hydrolysing)